MTGLRIIIHLYTEAPKETAAARYSKPYPSSQIQLPVC